MGATAVLAGPVAGNRGARLGSMVVMWDAGMSPASGADREPVTHDAPPIGVPIASALELRAKDWNCAPRTGRPVRRRSGDPPVGQGASNAEPLRA